MYKAFEYQGSELGLFRNAVNWKETLKRQIRPFVFGDVLEVGAGIGTMTEVLRTGHESSWTCLEPDPEQAELIRARQPDVTVMAMPLSLAFTGTTFDSILYVDVLEHIENDQQELMLAADCLNPGGFLLVLAPAHQWLYSPFDRAIGHFRRYTRQTLRSVAPTGLAEIEMMYLDSIGLLASLANRFLLSQSHVSHAQIAFWDRYMVRMSRLADPLTGFRIGKSILSVWQR